MRVAQATDTSRVRRAPARRDIVDTCTVSPPQETISGEQWWTDYQPVSYNIQGKRGDRAAFATMVDACHKVGVKVIAGAPCPSTYIPWLNARRRRDQPYDGLRRRCVPDRTLARASRTHD